MLSLTFSSKIAGLAPLFLLYSWLYQANRTKPESLEKAQSSIIFESHSSPQNYCLKGSSFQLVVLLMTSKLDSLFLFISGLFIPLKLVAPSPRLSVNFQHCPTKDLFLERIELPHFLKPGASAGK